MAMAASNQALYINIPVKLTKLKIAFSVAALAFEGDLPASIFHIQVIAKDIDDWKIQTEVIALFHTNAGHGTLNDRAYNADRMVATGNPYRELLTGLMKRGVQIELCGAIAAAHKWGNANLIPGVKVNTDAMARMSQLAQEGFVQITEWD
jgi:intracellular sulfur oxidation DsrE/DsrF family protein